MGVVVCYGSCCLLWELQFVGEVEWLFCEFFLVVWVFLGGVL